MSSDSVSPVSGTEETTNECWESSDTNPELNIPKGNLDFQSKGIALMFSDDCSVFKNVSNICKSMSLLTF